MDELSAELEAVAVQADREGVKFSQRLRETWGLLEPWVARAARAWSGSRCWPATTGQAIRSPWARDRGCPSMSTFKMQFATRLALASGFDTIARECRYVLDYLRTKVRVAAAVGPVQPDGTSKSGSSTSCAVLLLAANPDKDLALDEEVRAIEENIRASEHRAHVKFLPRLAARPGDLLRAMNELQMMR
jgi:hypothetical protein